MADLLHRLARWWHRRRETYHALMRDEYWSYRAQWMGNWHAERATRHAIAAQRHERMLRG